MRDLKTQYQDPGENSLTGGREILFMQPPVNALHWHLQFPFHHGDFFIEWLQPA